MSCGAFCASIRYQGVDMSPFIKLLVLVALCSLLIFQYAEATTNCIVLTATPPITNNVFDQGILCGPCAPFC